MKRILFLTVILTITNISCSVYETIMNISRLKFKLGDVNNFILSGIPVSGKTSIKDFSASETLKISSSVARGDLPVSFVLNVEAKNPNDGSGGYPKTNAAIKSFPWRLIIDDKETISGDISSSVSVPGTGEVINIPLQIDLDLVKFFKDKGYESLINMALNIGGYNNSSSKLVLYAQPVVSTSVGNISYPQEIKIVDTEFTK